MSSANTNISGSNIVFINNNNSFNNSQLISNSTSLVNTILGSSSEDTIINSNCEILFFVFLV